VLPCGFTLIVQALPTCKGSLETIDTSKEQSLIWRDGDAVCFRMLRRKNRPKGSGILRRVCSCSGGPHTCTLHQLWYGFFEELPVGCRPWRDITAAKARERLRQTLGRLGVNQDESYGTQDFRRGHAEVSSLHLWHHSHKQACRCRTCGNRGALLHRFYTLASGSRPRFCGTSTRQRWKRCRVQYTVVLRFACACFAQDVALAVAIESDGEEEWID
jgi:hypothetical protein